MARILALIAIAAFLAGCAAEAPETGPQAADPVADEPAGPRCELANTNNYGTQVNDLYVDGGEAWRETNGIPALQKVESCEGPADTRVAP